MGFFDWLNIFNPINPQQGSGIGRPIVAGGQMGFAPGSRNVTPGQIVNDAAVADPFTPAYNNYPSNPDYPWSVGSPHSSGSTYPGATPSGALNNGAQANDPYAYLDELARRLGGMWTNPDSEAAKAAGAFNPAIAALKREKGAATSRNKSNRKDSKADYRYLEQSYDRDAEAAAKQATQDEQKYNQEMLQGVNETSETYNKAQAENQAVLSDLGLGASTQALATQKMDAQKMQAVDTQRQMITAQKEYAVNEANNTADYNTAGANTAIQAGNEQDQALMRNLEDKLLALNKEQAGVQTQAAQAATQARQFAQNFGLSQIGTGLNLNQNRADIWAMLNPAAKDAGTANSAAQSSYLKQLKDTFGSGPIGATDYLKNSGINQDQANALLGTIFSDQELVNQQYAVGGNAGNMAKLTPQKAEIKIREHAKELGIDPDVALTYWFLYNGDA